MEALTKEWEPCGIYVPTSVVHRIYDFRRQYIEGVQLYSATRAWPELPDGEGHPAQGGGLVEAERVEIGDRLAGVLFLP